MCCGVRPEPFICTAVDQLQYSTSLCNSIYILRYHQVSRSVVEGTVRSKLCPTTYAKQM